MEHGKTRVLMRIPFKQSFYNLSLILKLGKRAKSTVPRCLFLMSFCLTFFWRVESLEERLISIEEEFSRRSSRGLNPISSISRAITSL